MLLFGDAAKAAGVPCITNTGIYPGLSNVMAAHMVSDLRREYDKDGNFKEADFDPQEDI